MTLARITTLAAASLALLGTAQAADQVIDLSSGQASFIATGPILAGGDDVLTFVGLPPGLYDFTFSISAQFIGGFGGTVNGTPFSVASLGPISAGAAFGVDTAPFTVVITGTPLSAFATYSGEITAVPEPSTWALFAGGLAFVAGVAMRRRG